MLTYRCVNPHKHSVTLDGKVVGHVHYLGTDQYQYRPAKSGKAFWGPVRDTMDAIYEDLEGAGQ